VYPADDNDYWVYPGSIDIDTNDPPSVSDQGSPAVGSLPASSIIIEMGSLHYPPEVTSLNAPPSSGVLLSIHVSGDCNVTVAEDATRGGVVNYDAESLTPILNNLTPCSVTGLGDCFPASDPNYSEWVTVGKPDSWCYPRQCNGDADNAMGKIGKQWYWVANEDLALLVTGYASAYGGDPDVDTWIAADFDHTPDKIGKQWYRVGNEDLAILVANYAQGTVDANCP
jgi:hypothetical protein